MAVDEGDGHNIPFVKDLRLERHEERLQGSLVHLVAVYRVYLNGQVEIQGVHVVGYWFLKAPAGG